MKVPVTYIARGSYHSYEFKKTKVRPLNFTITETKVETSSIIEVRESLDLTLITNYFNIY